MICRILFNGFLYNRRPTNDAPRLLNKNRDNQFTVFKNKFSAQSDIISNIPSCFEFCQKQNNFDATKIEIVYETGERIDITEFSIKRAYRNMLSNSYREVCSQILKSFFTKMIFHDVEYNSFLYSELKDPTMEYPLKLTKDLLKGENIDLYNTEIRRGRFAVGFKSQEEASFLKLCLPDVFSTKIIIPPSITEINDGINLLMFPGGENVS